MRRFILLCLTVVLTACVGTTEPTLEANTTTSIATPVVEFTAQCDGVWQLYLDTTNHGLWYFGAGAVHTVTTTAGTHTYEITRWAPSTRTYRDTVTANPAGAVVLPCP